MSIIINIKNKFLFSAKSDGATPNVEFKRLEEDIQEVSIVKVKQMETAIPTRTVATETGPVVMETGLVAREMGLVATEPARTMPMMETSSNVQKV